MRQQQYHSLFLFTTIETRRLATTTLTVKQLLGVRTHPTLSLLDYYNTPTRYIFSTYRSKVGRKSRDTIPHSPSNRPSVQNLG